MPNFNGLSPEVADRYRQFLTERGGFDAPSTQAQCEVRDLKDLKDRARAALRSAVYRGKIVKPSTCSRCGGKVSTPRDMHGHHADYTKPLDVEWLCQKCHQAEDGSGWKP